jgi:chromosome segregation and condensation protein ScpB
LPADIEALLTDYATGLKIAELVERYGINRSTVYAHLKRHYVDRRPTTKLTPAQIAEAAEAYRAGATSMELGERYGVGCDTILRRLRKAGVELRRSGRRRQT